MEYISSAFYTLECQNHPYNVCSIFLLLLELCAALPQENEGLQNLAVIKYNPSLENQNF